MLLDHTRSDTGPLRTLRLLANSPYASDVRRLQVDIPTYSSNLKTDTEWDPSVDLLKKVLRPCLKSFSGLQGLYFLTTCILFDGCLTNALASCDGRMATDPAFSLRESPLPMLTYLNLSLPLTRGFNWLLLWDSISHLAHNLRHLDMVITDPDMSTVEKVAEPLQLITMAPALQSLCIYTEYELSLDSLRLHPHTRLKTLRLGGTHHFTSDHLNSILDQCKASLIAVRFHQCEIWSGSWKHIVDKLSLCPNLACFSVFQCGISPQGPGSAAACFSRVVASASPIMSYHCDGRSRRPGPGGGASIEYAAQARRLNAG